GKRRAEHPPSKLRVARSAASPTPHATRRAPSIFPERDIGTNLSSDFYKNAFVPASFPVNIRFIRLQWFNRPTTLNG
ncbi:hypothetical protein, partial [Lentibacillus sp.]|uniref:hypothetical protein n=1 Tax=Lentibacillus sp. TaxID=1925746 RepID=UPI002B4B423F